MPVVVSFCVLADVVQHNDVVRILLKYSFFRMVDYWSTQIQTESPYKLRIQKLWILKRIFSYWEKILRLKRGKNLNARALRPAQTYPACFWYLLVSVCFHGPAPRTTPLLIPSWWPHPPPLPPAAAAAAASAERGSGVGQQARFWNLGFRISDLLILFELFLLGFWGLRLSLSGLFDWHLCS